MAKITREPQLIFGSSLIANNNIAKFGSLKVGSPAYSLDPSEIQTTAYLNGWGAAVVNNNAPALQDMNGLFYLTTYQLAYLMQAGIPEWNASTTYYIGSLVNDAAGNIFMSRVDDNTNQALTDATKWKPIVQTGVSSLIGAGSSDIDAQTGNAFRKTGSSSATNIGLVNMYEGQTIVVNIESVASQAAITWKRGTNGGGTADIKWANQVVPTPTTSASRVDRYMFQMINGVIYGSADMNCY